MTARPSSKALVFADSRLLEPGARAAYASHRRDDDWFFASAEFLGQSDEPNELVRVSLGSLMANDATLAEVCDLEVGWHAFRSTPDAPWWSGEAPTGDVHLLAYEVRPNERLEERDGIGGAFVNALVVGESLQAARTQAERHLDESGWTVVRTLKEAHIGASQLTDQWEAYRRRAEIDGEVYVIHAFPPEAADA